MSPGKIDSVYVKRSELRICQGDVFYELSVPTLRFTEEGSRDVEISLTTIPYAVIMSQDCDLESDYKNHQEVAPAKHDKYLPTILLCPAYLPEEFKKGIHLGGLKYVMENHPTERYKQIKKQQVARYHFIESDFETIPDLVIDFKHYLSVPRELVYRQHPEKYAVALNYLYREGLSQRFAYYLSRIGLPELSKTPTEDGHPPTCEN